ncbi:uncharacterized protein [Procambarus clarkii]|uniref:uncharacterized protein isoform X2 n=1 Tax=Procambarus clarkii TaxID=6728 RepID=UPI003742AB67
MMSTLDSSGYRRQLDTPHQVRPVVGAPYVLCVFIVAVILVGVGTFVTAYAYENDPHDPVLLVVGPSLLGLGGLLLLGSVLVCVVACCKNRHLREAFSDDLLNIGGSTFYGGRGFVQLEDETQLYDPPPRHHLQGSAVMGVSNPAGPDHAEAIMILANTVAEERDRQRKNSRKYSRNLSQEPSRRSEERSYPKYYLGPQGHSYSPEDSNHLEHLGLERLRRADAYPELAEDFDLGETDESTERFRDRSYSMSVRRPVARLAPVPDRLRRNVTFTAASQASLQQQQQQLQFLRQQQHQMRKNLLLQEPQYSGLHRKRSSKRKKGVVSREQTPEPIKVHHLPLYNPDLLSALGIQPKRFPLERGQSDHGLLDQGRKESPEVWREDPDVTHGSLGNPRRRPSVVMGVRSIRAPHSGSAYRHHSIYASDMDLHRAPAGVSDSGDNLSNSVSGYGQEPRSPLSPVTAFRNFSITGSDTEDRRQRASPVLHLLHPSEGSLSSLNRNDSKRDNSTLPRSSSASPSQGRPLSNISSESCCSGCCDSDHDNHTGVGDGEDKDTKVENGDLENDKSVPETEKIV